MLMHNQVSFNYLLLDASLQGYELTKSYFSLFIRTAQICTKSENQRDSLNIRLLRP